MQIWHRSQNDMEESQFGGNLKEICGTGQKQYNLWIRRSCTMWLIKIIRQIEVIRQ